MAAAYSDQLCVNPAIAAVNMERMDAVRRRVIGGKRKIRRKQNGCGRCIIDSSCENEVVFPYVSQSTSTVVAA